MKKLMTVLIVLSLGCGVIAQKNIRNISDITKTSYSMGATLEDAIQRVVSTGKSLDYSEINRLHFVKNGMLFMLAYEPMDEELLKGSVDSRRIYLYRRDENGWKLASNVILNNYYKDYQDFTDVDFHYYDTGDYGKVFVKGDTVTMIIGWDLMKRGHMVTRPVQIIFKPSQNDKNYYKVDLKR